MIQHLGKIIVFILLFPFILLADAKLNAPNSFFEGDKLEFSISANGTNITIPDIKKIGSYNVQTLGTSTQTRVYNGNKTTIITKNYALVPKGDITLPELEVQIDGKTYKTKPKKIKMLQVEKTLSDLYSFDLEVDKNEAYVGEGVKLVISFKYRRDLNILSLEFEKPNFEGFWVKKLNDQTQDKDPKYFNQTLTYLLFPQKEGKKDIGAFRINVITSSGNYSNSFFFTNATNATPVYSNRIALNVKPLPKGVDLIGKFSIEGSVDKTEVKAGEAVSYKLKIQGEGNIDDIREMPLSIPDVTIYENPAKKEYKLTDDIYGGEYDKVYSIVASKDFTIPSITLQYFDKATQSIKTLQTKEYFIKVKGQVQKEAVLQTASPVKNETITNSITKPQIVQNSKQEIMYGLFFILGLVSAFGGVVLYKILSIKKQKKIEDTPLIVLVKKANTPDTLLKVIVNYINIDKDLDKIIYQLETCNDMKEFKNIKKEVIKIVQHLQIPAF